MRWREGREGNFEIKVSFEANVELKLKFKVEMQQGRNWQEP